MDVDALFGEPTVALRGPWNASDLVKIAPTARDLAGGLYEYHLDFPGNALDPGCDYERWARRITEGHDADASTRTSRPTRPPRQARAAVLALLRLQRLEQPARGRLGDDPARLRRRERRRGARAAAGEVGYSQHEGAERATWGDDKLELVDGTHPVVYPAAGSHANFFDEALFLGSSAEQGVGCDDTTRPARRPAPGGRATIPSDPAQARAAFPWIDFQGRWGELQPAFFNGPTGPEPEDAVDGSRSSGPRAGATGASPSRPGARSGRRRPTSSAARSAAGSKALVRLVDRPLAVRPGRSRRSPCCSLFALSRTTWRPTAPLRLARRRAWGQIARRRGAHVRRRSRGCSSGSASCSCRSRVLVTRSCRRSCCTATELPRRRDRRRERRAARLRRGRDRHRADAARPRPRPGGDGAGARRDRPGSPDRAAARLPARRRQRPAAPRRARDRGHRRLAARRARSS